MDLSLDEIPMDIEEDDNMAGPSTLHNTDSESDDENSSKIRKRKKVASSKLPVHFKGLMGEANLRFARGDLVLAKKMCYEVIRNCPDAYEPYLTLSQMYENVNLKKYRGYLLLASHMNPSGEDIMCRLADTYLQENQPLEAIACYTKLLRNGTCGKNMDIHYKRLSLVEKHCNIKQVLRCKQTLAKNLPIKNFEGIISICMELGKEFFNQKNYIRALEVLDIPFKRVPTKITLDLLNMMLESLLYCDRFTECLDLFIRYCSFEFDVFVEDNQKITVNSYTLPENLQVDLKVKFIICLIKLQSLHLVPELIDSIIINDDVDIYGDLYLDIVEALITVMPQEALKLLIPLVKSKNFSLAAIWLKYAECLSMCEMPEQSIEAYFTVMALAPQHVEVLYPLAMLLLNQGKQQEALDVLSQDLTTNKMDVAVLMERMKLLKKINHLEDYWKSAELLLSRHCVVLKNPEELKIVTINFSVREKVTKLKKMREFRGDNSDIESNFISIKEPSVEEEYSFYRNILQFAKDTENYAMYQKFSFMGLCSKRFLKFTDEIFLSAFYSCMLKGDIFHGYTTIRDIILKHNYQNIKNNLAWNWFNVILQKPEDCRYIRFLERLQNKFSAPTIKVIEANYNISVGNYMTCLTFFMQEYKRSKTSFSALMLGIIILQLYSQKYNKHRKKLFAETATYLFMNYKKSRTKSAEQEVFYNLGRMYQQLGITYLAEHYYNRVLYVENSLLEQYPDILCLKREAAFNLHIIYKNAGNFIAARNVLIKNIVV
ncbi:unnamed protein product [Brassicogethes aeneus]|uniref:General transcription factor 3C polypeptide 3 n=1 Tax=Brassicogethes aeneus TaxID=1431903 RepID=A0A9P0BJW8_BRAAE|nr:unnamed protein product [Brassicogethes aeneus]